MTECLGTWEHDRVRDARARQRAERARNCARDRLATVHCLCFCSWALFMNTVHGHCSKN